MFIAEEMEFFRRSEQKLEIILICLQASQMFLFESFDFY